MSKQRPSLGGDPLDTVLGDWSAAPRRPGPVVATPSPRRVRATFHLPHALVEEARNATVALSGPPTRLTLARLVEDAVRREIARLRVSHNGGAPFPQRHADLIGGRPIGGHVASDEGL
jgi:hypothetical protein